MCIRDSFESTQARYVRISGKKPVSKYGYSIYELEIYNNSSIVDVASIDFDVDTTELYVGQEVDLAVKVSPENATYPLPVYTSSNEDIIKIVNGKMIARKAGNVVITAEADGQTTTMNIKVVDENKFKIANELDTLVIKNGKIQFPTSDRYKFIIESSSHEKVIGLDGVVHTPINDTSVDIVAVSYTHLDVYKRQVKFRKHYNEYIRECSDFYAYGIFFAYIF